MHWSVSVERRPEIHEFSFESGLDDPALSDIDSSCATDSMFSSSSSGTDSGDFASSSMDEEEKLPQPEGDVSNVPEPGTEERLSENTKIGDEDGDFLSWLTKNKPQMAVYEVPLRRDGWDSLQCLRILTPDDMADLNILPGHRRLLVDTLKDL